MSLVEVVVALSVLVVAASIFCQMLLSTSRMRHLSRENTLAADAARVVFERMRNVPFHQVYRQFNASAADDPGGSGTGPGNLFDVEGLEPLDDAPGGKVGQIFFPDLAVTVVSGGGGKLGGFGGTSSTSWQVREDVEDSLLGMPRDLNGNNVIDTDDHASDYLVLPVRLLIQWKSGGGARRFEIVSQLGEFPRVELP